MAKKGKQYSKIAGTWEEVKPSYTDLADVPSTFTPTSHTHGNITNGGEITASATIATGDHLVIADNSSGNDLTTSTITFDTTNTTTFLRKDGTWATPPAANGLNFVNTISLTTAKTGTDLYNAGLDGEGDYLIVNGGGDITNAGTPLITLAVQAPGDEGNSTPPVTLETGDWILFKSFDSQNNILEVILMNNNDATKAAAVHTHDDRYYTETESDNRFVNVTGDTMTGDLSITASDASDPYFIKLHNTSNASKVGIQFKDDTNGTQAGFLTFEHSDGASPGSTGTTFKFDDNSGYGPAVQIVDPDGGFFVGTNKVFHDGYHPNADTLTTARSIALSGDVTGSANFDGSANISITATVADDSHNHTIANVDGLQTALDGKLSTSGKAADSNLLDGIDSGSFLRSDTADTASGKITFATGIARSAHNTGFLEGSYNNVGGNGSNSNPIYVIGSNYIPSTTTLGNMYGIGYTANAASFINFTGSNGWGMYVAADGDARIWLDGSNGVVSSVGEHYVGSARVFHDSYHPNADTWTTARTLTINGDGSGAVSWDGSANATLSLTNQRMSELGTITYGAGWLQWTDQSGNGGTGLNGAAPGNPTNEWWHHLIMNHANSGGYYFDIAAAFHTDQMYFRRNVNGNLTTWRELIHSGNIGSQSVSNADTVDGFHASQTAGSANTAVVRNSSGYIMNTWFNSSRSNETSAAASYIYDTGDGYMRKKTLANAQAEIVTSSAVTSALGYTPYNSTNPSGYTTNTGTVTSVATGGGLTGGTITTSGTISHADTSSQASVNNSGNTFIQDITLDTYGHITAITSATADNVGNADTVDGYHAVAFVRNVYSEFLDDAFPAAPLTTSFTSWSKPTGMPSVTLEANSRYYVFAAGSYYTGATTTGIGISPTFSTVSGQIRGGSIWINTATSTTAGTSEFTANWRTMSTSGGVTGNFALGTAGPTTIPGNEFGFYGIVETSGTSTVLSMHIRSEVNGSNVYVNRLAITAMKLPT